MADDLDGRELRRNSSWLRGSTLGAAVLLGAALLGMVNYLGDRYYQRFDWTSGGLFTLSEKSENLLRGLDRDIDFVIFISSDDELYGPVRELLSRYEAASPRVHTREVDPVRNLAEAEHLVEEFQIDRQDVVIVAAGEDRRIVAASELSEVDFGGPRARVSGFRGEQAFSNAILELTEASKPKIVFTEGHGERAVGDFSADGLSDLRTQLGRDNFEITGWSSLTEPRVPEGTDLVVVAGPQTPFLEPELRALSEYLASSGRLLLLLDPRVSEESPPLGFEEWLAGYGVEAINGIVIDPEGRVPFFSDETFQVTSFVEHPVTRAFEQAGIPIVLTLARPVLATSDPASGDFEAVEILRTGASGWGEQDLAALPEVAFGEGDLDGPVALAVAVERSAPAPGESPGEVSEEISGEIPAASETMRMVVFGNSTFAANRMIGNAGNGALLNNAFNWLVQRPMLLGIPARQPEHVRLDLDVGEATRLYLFVLLALPALAVAMGIAVHRRRRR